MAAIGKKATLTRQVPYTAHCKPYVSVCLSGPYTFLCRYPIRSSDFPGDISPDPLCDCHSCVYWTYSDPKSEPTSELSPVWVIHHHPGVSGWFFEDTRYVRLPKGVNQYELDEWLRSKYGKGLDEDD